MEHANDTDFDEKVLNSEIPVIVDFWAEWCMPCQMFGPIFEETSKEFEGKVKFVKVNTEEAPSIAQRFEIMSIPAVLFFKGGEVVSRSSGMMAKERLAEEAEKLL